jgi:hypothetical protein
VKLQEYLLG